LETVPPALPDFYRETITRIQNSERNDEDLAFRVLSWIFHSPSSMWMRQLQEALSIREGDRKMEDNYLLDPTDLVECCQGLVEHENKSGMVRFTHYSVYKFLDTNYRQCLLSRVDLAKICLCYLTMDTVRDSLAGNEQRMERLFQMNSNFGVHAVQFWGFYAQGEEEECSAVHDLVFRLVRSKRNMYTMIQIDTLCGNSDQTVFQTALHVFARYGLPKLCKLLLKDETVRAMFSSMRDLELARAQFDWKAAERAENWRILEILQLGAVSLCGDVKSKDSLHNTPLHYAARAGHADVARVLLADGAEVDEAMTSSKTPLHLAAACGSAETTKVLLDADANTRLQDKSGLTALHWAAACGSVETVSLLLGANARVTISDNSGMTPLHYAGKCGSVDTLKLLLNARTDIGARDAQGYSALHWATIGGSVRGPDALNLLINAGIDVQARTKRGLTSLHIAAETGSLDMVKVLLDAGAEVMAQQEAGMTALHYAAMFGSAEMVQILLDAAILVHTTNDAGATALHLAASKGHVESVKMLLKAGADVNLPTHSGKTALHFAADSASVETLKTLLMVGATPNVQDLEGYVPLHHAASSGSLESVEVLLDANADPKILSSDDKWPLHAAVYCWHGDIMKKLFHVTQLGQLSGTEDCEGESSIDENELICKELLKRFPDDPLLHRGLGLSYLRKGMAAEASAAFDLSVELDPMTRNAISISELTHAGLHCTCCRLYCTVCARPIYGFLHKCKVCTNFIFNICEPYLSEGTATGVVPIEEDVWIPSDEWVSKNFPVTGK
jgi:ankyrin repeat protein